MVDAPERPRPPQARKIPREQTEHFDREGFSGDIYVKEDDGVGYNALGVDVHGAHPLKEIKSGTRSYLVMEGTGNFHFKR
ncbi:hypothetical protein A3G67_03925 [Candidatus Roizmanbacteria bacterium RIFCSPLOWO2_12_FULL_40_12]|uniref:Cupin 2 conserved barrel domain-containing protein n=1 Tax=Candidatus Roizmanbacteria bacterium RIFCSPLOWO2_01_FULL_40_42 TaxID=1802066 RepID=A0A1F7J5V5_9BACT|nr:MAG: hypothetical protein A2779_03560 [Candidatus Roizmanbacteria bacterium RIFCSPHIGHO2_01_FULL_40_98]OGK28412.1 MAG: hypothetical protein A3C31_00925 [Candidatus Roizmanbacteria bacterium RIFCSPHIGHO2_02_FULL_40_53]OGK30648.1 MAG: hypothetical protein A2W49_03610 [Candidatus Roizmanbacteria bacterium RIFCSPHIGHO2_12_41_18]OGK35976.1 MAG: hypothetical protein A3E69_03295 [Candidatus Roizmanbacteria bacterium RIFCSPHIGHO2_12_FULL_40_130]OGK50968.1 MAG: hypothetical protein A3B50_01695 [Candi